ncbi:MAG: folylpolyglutamate synthase/dihydrofolate synthase family protein [Robiginitalea sp.]|nr:folylpolyglutamate synthase/dihydrofolate synthase family protein [Robiginitalea sp.]
MYQRKGAAAYNAKLQPSIDFAAYLGDPHRKFKSIHVAGTNGKGSSSHMLASILQEGGYKVGLYTSPHLKDFRERIRINGLPVSKHYVIGFVQRHRKYFQAHPLSFFEMTVGMAFEYFEREAVDIAVIEVGLGGRLDSTNIITPQISLITNIAYDHMEFLGDTLPEIAREKAGIIKPGVPVVISETQPETQPVFQQIARERQAPIYFAEAMDLPEYPTSLLGAYQRKNVRGVLTTLKTLDNFGVSESQIKKGLKRVVENTGLLGRWQTLGEHPKIICDTAHNREGLELVIRQLLEQPFDRLHMVLGFVREKPLEKLLPLFPKNASFYFARPDIPRGLDADILKAEAEKQGMRGIAFSSVENALKAAKQAAAPEDLIFVGGSTFTVAEVL